MLNKGNVIATAIAGPLIHFGRLVLIKRCGWLYGGFGISLLLGTVSVASIMGTYILMVLLLILLVGCLGLGGGKDNAPKRVTLNHYPWNNNL